MAGAVDTYFSIDDVVDAGHCASALLLFSENELEANFVAGDVVKAEGLAIYLFRGVVADRQILVSGLKIVVITEV
jgi:hypothetical protein